MKAHEHFARIDRIRSVSEMQSELSQLSEEKRRDVILYALSFSRFQFTWSHFAKHFEIPKWLWPPQPETQPESADEP